MMRLMISDGRPKAQKRFSYLLCCDMAKLSTFSLAILKGEITSAGHYSQKHCSLLPQCLGRLTSHCMTLHSFEHLLAWFFTSLFRICSLSSLSALSPLDLLRANARKPRPPQI